MKKFLSIMLSALIIFSQFGGVVNIVKADSWTCNEEDVACIGEDWYATLAEAVNAAQTWEEVLLQKDAEWAWIAIMEANAKNITINLNEHTYTVNSTLVGSAWYESQSFHFEKWSKVLIKNGEVTTTNASMLVQNYCDLILEDVVVDGSNLQWTYVMSNNFGSLTLKWATEIIVPEWKVAFDLWYGMFPNYDEWVTVTIDSTFNWSIEWIIEYWAASRIAGTDWTNKAKIEVNCDPSLLSWVLIIPSSDQEGFKDNFKTLINLVIADTEYGVQEKESGKYIIAKKAYSVTFDWANEQFVNYWATVEKPADPTKSCNRFNWWYNGDTPYDFETPVTSDLTLTAKWTYICGGGWSSSSSSNKTPTTTWTVETWTVNTWVDNNKTWESSRYEEWNQQEVLKNWFTREFNNAYNFAYLNWITTMNSIQKADMEWNLNRIAMAKMLSQYAINVLGKTPDTTKKCEFKDVTSKMDKDYNDWVTLACQLGIMWMNMWDNFRPNDTVVRAEFGTALSRMIYGISDWKDQYYSTHLAKLKAKKVITNDNPSLQELRWYVMLMLMRSAK